jgi:hypothetical protein
MVPFHPPVHPLPVCVDRPAARNAIRLVADLTEIEPSRERSVAVFKEDPARLKFVPNVIALKNDVRWWVNQVLSSDDRSTVNTCDELSALSHGEVYHFLCPECGACSYLQ